MSWCNAHTKILNFLPKEHSKTQQAKREYLEKHPIEYICCERCQKHNTTLYKNKDDKKYYCKECK